LNPSFGDADAVRIIIDPNFYGLPARESNYCEGSKNLK
jgi:hypothetical protein